jgi:hypothetical protein
VLSIEGTARFSRGVNIAGCSEQLCEYNEDIKAPDSQLLLEARAGSRQEATLVNATLYQQEIG